MDELKRGAGEVIARSIADRMEAPLLEDLRRRLSADEFAAVLLLARDQLAGLDACPLDPRLIGFALAAAAAMWAEAYEHLGETLGAKGSGSSN
jgi:hypothetical protein